MKIKSYGKLTVYNEDKKEIQELYYPEKIELSDEANIIAEKVRSGKPEEAETPSFIMQLAQSSITGACKQDVCTPPKSKVVSASSQYEGGLFVHSTPDNVAFFECMFKHAKKENKENFGFNCRPIFNPMLGGPDNWLYGHLYQKRCQQVYDRETGSVIPAPPGVEPPYGQPPLEPNRYYCVVSDGEIKRFVEDWREALNAMEEYDTLISIGHKLLGNLPVKDLWAYREDLERAVRKEEDKRKQEAMIKIIEQMAIYGKIEPSEEFRKLFIKPYRKEYWKD